MVDSSNSLIQATVVLARSGQCRRLLYSISVVELMWSGCMANKGGEVVDMGCNMQLALSQEQGYGLHGGR